MLRVLIITLLFYTNLSASPLVTPEPSAFTGLAPSKCYTSREIQVQSGEFTLAGDLTVPRGEGPFPAVQMITGSGPHTRDETISGSHTFRQIATFLARHGVAVLRSDARGFGASSGPADTEATTTAERAADNRAIYDFLKRQPQVDPKRIVLFGHSEGAMIAVMLAAHGLDPALLALMGPSAIPGNEVLAWQMTNNLRKRGADDATADAVHVQLLRFFDLLVNDPDNRAEFEIIANDFLAAHGVPREEIDPTFAQSLLVGYFDSRWDRFFAGYDPRADIAKVKAPIAAFFAGVDENVPWQQHLPALVDAVIEGKRNTDLGLHVIPDQDHYFLEYEGKRMEKHRFGEMQVAPALLLALEQELAQHGLLGETCED